MTAPAKFLSLWRSGIRYIRVLAEIDLRDPVTLAVTTLRFGTAETMTPEGFTVSGAPTAYWSPMLSEVQPISAPGSFGSTGIELCSTSITLLAGALPTTMLLDGATVRLYLWDTRLTDWDDGLLVFSGVVVQSVMTASNITLNLRQRTNWNRDIVPVTVTPEKYPHAPDDSMGQPLPVVYGKLRDVAWRYPWPEYPLAEDVTTTTVLRGIGLMLGGRRAATAVLVDTGRGAKGSPYNPAAKILCASHKVARLGDHKTGTGFFMKGEVERPIAIEVETPGTDIINTATEAGILIRDNGAVGWVAVLPVDVFSDGDTCDNARALLDPWNDNNYARFDWTGGFKTARLKLPTLPDLGEMTEMFMFCGYRFVAGTNLKFRFRSILPGSTATPVDATLAISPTRRIVMARLATTWGHPVTAPYPVTPWAFSECEIEVGWPQTTTAITGSGTAEIYFAGFLVKYRPKQEVILTERVTSHLETRPVNDGEGKTRVPKPYMVEERLPATVELRGKYFANVDGWQDVGGAYAGETVTLDFGTALTIGPNIDFSNAPQVTKDNLLRLSAGDYVSFGSGLVPIGSLVVSYNPTTFVLTLNTNVTSAASTNFLTLRIDLRGALIERAPDILAHLLVNYGGDALVEAYPGIFGSFIDARAALKNSRNRDMTYALSIDSTTDIMTAASWLAEGSFSFLFIDRFTDVWRIRPWRLDAPVDYPWTLRPEDIIERDGVAVSQSPQSHLSTAISISYSYNALDTNAVQKTRLGWDGSNAGYKWRGTRDGSLIVDTSNNKLTWQLAGSGPFTATLTSGAYSPQAFGTHVAARMLATDAVHGYLCIWGATIVANVNDQLLYRDLALATDHLLTLTPGYYTFEALAAHVQDLMETANFSAEHMLVSWSRSTRKWTFERQYSILGPPHGVSIYGLLDFFSVTTPGRHRSFLMTIGFNPLGATKTTGGHCEATGEWERDDETFMLGSPSNGGAPNLLWETGPNGLNLTRTDCHALLGFAGLRDSIGVGLTPPMAGILADGPKAELETPLLTAASRFGARRDTILDSRAIQDTETARELRNRLAAAFALPRLQLDFSTEMMPDLERTRVIQFSKDFDAVMPYPDPDSDGSWVGKRFVVVETEQQLGPAAFYTKVRAVALD